MKSKIYRYKIGYGTCEESSFVELEHSKKFSKDQITEMIGEAILSMFIEVLERWHERIEKAQYQSFMFKFEEFWREGSENGIPEWLVKNKGFKRVEYEVEWDVFGWASVLDKDDWRMHRGENDELSKITDYLEKNGIKESMFNLTIKEGEEE